MTFPSPNVILPLISRTVTSPICLIAVCILTGVGPCMPSPSRQAPAVRLRRSLARIPAQFRGEAALQRPPRQTYRRLRPRNPRHRRQIPYQRSRPRSWNELEKRGTAPAHPAAAAALPPALRDHVKQILQLQFPHALLYQRSFGALADPLPSPLYAKLGALGDGQLSGAKLSPPPEALSIEYPRCQRKVSTEFMAVGAEASRAALLSLCFESEISFRWRSGTHRDFLRLRAIGLLPSRQRIVARRHVAERVRAVVIAGGGRSLHHRHVAAHPRMNIALHMDCDFLRRP